MKEIIMVSMVSFHPSDLHSHTFNKILNNGPTHPNGVLVGPQQSVCPSLWTLFAL